MTTTNTPFEEGLDEILLAHRNFVAAANGNKLSAGSKTLNPLEARQALTQLHEAAISEAVDAAEARTADIEFKAGINHATVGGDCMPVDEYIKTSNSAFDQLVKDSNRVAASQRKQ
ncbi:hypothetical protein AHiyo8_59140 [Arthrobacter sp. Hiyo8]|uniref:hypothetical protein n=1 Tax=Arthrobacter sp. Hiyo1 TaxID=1588020 RepID=UPI000683A8FF|nr:hypothetical protein [Arthrobacter sp. Hiyo1]BAS17611.1 hypothetical protein AHiyo8_59140 [Arthrobacter sp. Hiyo8]GAP57969.1 hypothetical protein AHiyo1_09310 [Arthrobacter sp. Hiyo1]